MTTASCLGAALAALCVHHPVDGPCPESQNALKKPLKYNVLLIMTDDMNDNLGCYGHKMVKTPNIDKLAAKGVLFEQAYCQFPLSGPSRACMLTGLRADTLGVLNNEIHFREAVPEAVTLPQLFSRNGYFVARTGKIFHYGVPGEIGTNGADDPASWDTVINPLGRDKREEHLVTNMTPGKSLGVALAYRQCPGTDAEQTDGMVADAAIELMKQADGRPFFVAAGFFRPHCPYIAPKKYFDLYDPDAIEIPAYSESERLSVPPLALTTKPANYGLPDDSLRRITQAYYASISFVDAQVGRLLNCLDSMGLSSNTIVVFVSDHGYLLGEHGLWQKYTLFDEALRVPMIAYFPGMKVKTHRLGAVVEQIDIYPTLAEFCGLSLQMPVDGKSLVSYIRKGKPDFEQVAYSVVSRSVKQDDGTLRYRMAGRSMRTSRWLYSEWDRGESGRALFDMIHDPMQTVNLVDESKYKSVVDSLQRLVK